MPVYAQAAIVRRKINSLRTLGAIFYFLFIFPQFFMIFTYFYLIFTLFLPKIQENCWNPLTLTFRYDIYKSRNILTWYKQRLPLLVKSINHESTSRRFFFIWRKNEARNPVRSAFVASLKRQSGFLEIWVTAGQKLETADYKPLKTRQRRDI